jgi:hypothetical protein
VHALRDSTSRADVAVIEVDDTGTGTLHLGGELIEHVVTAQPVQVVRVLLDYAATVSRDLTVVSRHTEGRLSVHQLRPDGNAVPLQDSPAESLLTEAQPPQCGPLVVRGRSREVHSATARAHSMVCGSRAVSRQWLVRHGLWLMLCAQILVLVGSLTFIVVALAPYLWPRP